MSRKLSLCRAAFMSLPVMVAPVSVNAVIFYSTGDPTHNTTAPGGALADAGWQWSLGFGTAIAPHYILVAAHTGSSAGFSFSYMGQTYNTIAFPDTSPHKDFGDLRVLRVDNTLYSFAPLYNASADGSEIGDNSFIVGRGTQRGTSISVGGEPKGWNWGSSDGTLRWGRNIVSGTDSEFIANDLLTYTFDRTGQGDSVTDEVHVSAGDSGSGNFILVGNQWKLAGVNRGVDAYRYTNGGANVTAAFYDTGGLYDTSNNLIPNGASDVPSVLYASRVSARRTSILGVIDLGPTWNVDASSSWTTSSNWSTLTVPNAIGAVADFRTVIGSARTVTLGSSQTVGTIDFDNINRYTISGAGTLIIDVSSGTGTVNVVSGSHTISTPVTLNDSTNFNVLQSGSSLTLSGNISASGKTITKLGPGTLELKHARASSLVVSAGRVNILSNGGDSGTGKVSTLSVAGGTKLDLTNNDIVIDHTGSSPIGSWTGSAYTGLTGQIASGFNDGTWTGNGIISSTAAAGDGYTTLAIADAADALSLSGSATTIWSGQTVDATSVLIGYTYGGDANLSGAIDVDDYGQIDFNVSIGGSLKGYYNGDFNYDGVIDVDDYGIIDFNVSTQGGPLTGAPSSSISSVPEPSSLLATCGFSTLLLARRKRAR